MGIPVHVVERLDGGLVQHNDRLFFGRFKIANLIGGGAGAAVATAVTSIKGLPPDYSVQVIPDQDATVFVTSKTQAGFTFTLTPRLAATTLAVGANEVLIFG